MGRFAHSQRFGFPQGLRPVPTWLTGVVTRVLLRAPAPQGDLPCQLSIRGCKPVLNKSGDE